MTTPIKAKTLSETASYNSIPTFLQLWPSNRPLELVSKKIDRSFQLLSRRHIYIATPRIRSSVPFRSRTDRLFVCSAVKRRNRLASMILLASSRTQQNSKLCTIPARCTHTRRVCRGYIERSVPSCNPIDRATPFPRYAYPIYLDFPCVPPLRVSYVSRPAHLSLLRFHPPRNNKESRWINRPLEIDYLTLFFQRVSKYPRGGESRLVRLGEKGFALFRRNRNKLGPFNSRSPRNFSPRLNFHRA